MRATCESCHQAQPQDWRPGDLCVHCGKPARPQARCYWCAHWIPAGNFCRLCGAESIEAHQYGPARMMKFYGADMFSIPQKLREMDPARVETFRAIYGRHLSIAMRYVDELRELEGELFLKVWSSPFEEELIPQLPWQEQELALYSNGRQGRGSPFPLIHSLSTLVQLRRGDFKLLTEAGYLLGSDELRVEAALQLANWRVSGNVYLENLRHPAIDCLRQVPTALAQLSLAYLGDREAKPRLQEALTDEDPEVRFLGALLSGEERPLVDALRSTEALRWMVAARKLIQIGRADALVTVFRERADNEQQMELLQSLHSSKRAVPELHTALFEVMDRDPGTRLSRMAAKAICLGCTQAEAMRLARTLDQDILHSVSLSKGVEPETYREIGELLVGAGNVSLSQYFWICVAKPGRMPEDFVERIFRSASTPELQTGLLRFAEKQLEGLDHCPRGTAMERVLIRAAFDDLDPGVIGAAWACLHRINYRREYGSPSPFLYTVENIEQFWPLWDFEERLGRLQSNEAALEQTFVKAELGRFIGSKESIPS